MSPDDGASLPADMITSTSSLEKDLERTKTKMAETEKTAEKGVQQQNAALEAEKTEIGNQRVETKKFAEEHPFPHPDIKPWSAKPPPVDPIQGFGSWASALGILAGAVTHTGLASSLNASAAAITAMRKNDMDAYHEAYDAWKENSEIAIKQADWEVKSYQNAFDLMQKDQAAGISQLRIAAEQAQNSTVLAKLQQGNLKDVWDMTMALKNSVDQGPERMLRVQELKAKVDDQTERAKLLKQAYDDPKNANMTPEEKARLRTQIMNPQYTLNQAKTLAEGGVKPTLDDDTVNYLATIFRDKGTMPSMGFGTQGALQRAQIYKAAADQAKASGSTTAEDIVRASTIKSEQSALNKLIPQKAALETFENTALKNGKVLQDLAHQVDQTGVPVIERWLRAGRTAVDGDPDVTKFNTQLGVFAPEVAKILTNPNLSGVLTDAARTEVEGFLPRTLTAGQIDAIVPLLEGDFGRRSQALDEEIGTVQSTIRNVAGGGSTNVSGKADHPAIPSSLKDKQDLHWSPSQKKWWWKENGEDKSGTGE